MMMMMMMMIIIIIIMIINYIPIIRLALSSYTQVYEKSDPPDTGGGGQATCRGWRSERGQSGRRRSLEKVRIWREDYT